MLSIGALILVLLTGLPLLRLLFFLLSNAMDGRLGDIRSACGGRLGGPLLSTYATAVGSEGTAPALFVTGLGHEPMPKPEGTPVLLLHGLYHNRSAWHVFRRRLSREGFHNVRAFSYGSWRGGLDDALETVRAELRRTMAANPGKRVLLVGHSLGGVIWRIVAAEDEFRDHVGALATLGSPFGGSELALLGVGRVARSLVPGREACRKLRTVKDTPAPKLAVVSPVDDFVFPYGCLEPGGGWRRENVSAMAHVWMLYSPSVARTVIPFLKEAA